MGDWDLICGEAMATLESMPDNSVNAIVTDPPYSSGGGAWDASANSAGKIFS